MSNRFSPFAPGATDDEVKAALEARKSNAARMKKYAKNAMTTLPAAGLLVLVSCLVPAITLPGIFAACALAAAAIGTNVVCTMRERRDQIDITLLAREIAHRAGTAAPALASAPAPEPAPALAPVFDAAADHAIAQAATVLQDKLQVSKPLSFRKGVS